MQTQFDQIITNDLPNESCNKRVSFESRYGTCMFAWFGLLLLMAFERFTNEEMQRPNVCNDKLIFVSSLMCSSPK